jgi:hypothetical protein
MSSLKEIQDQLAKECTLPTVALITVETRAETISTKRSLLLVDLKQPRFSEQLKSSPAHLNASIKNIGKIMTSIVRNGAVGTLPYGREV